MTPQTNPGLVPGGPIVSQFAEDADMRELVAMFIEELPDKVRAIERLSESRDLDLLRRLAHQLKGASGGYGFPTVGAAAGTLEGTLDQALSGTDPVQQLPAIQHQVDALISVCRRVQLT